MEWENTWVLPSTTKISLKSREGRGFFFHPRVQKRFLGKVLFDVDQEQKDLKWVRRGFRGGRVFMATGLTGDVSTTEEAWDSAP